MRTRKLEQERAFVPFALRKIPSPPLPRPDGKALAIVNADRLWHINADPCHVDLTWNLHLRMIKFLEQSLKLGLVNGKLDGPVIGDDKARLAVSLRWGAHLKPGQLGSILRVACGQRRGRLFGVHDIISEQL